MSPLTQAISQGFSSEQVIEYLLRHFPKYSKQINQALGQGFSANQVLKYLNKGRKGVNEFEGELTEHEKTRKSDKEKQKNLEKNIGKGALALGAAGLGAYALNRGAQSIVPEVLPALQQPNQPNEGIEIDLTPKITNQQRQLQHQAPNQLIQQAKQPQPNQPIDQPQAPQMPNAPIAEQSQNAGAILQQLGIKEKVDALRQNNPPEMIPKILAATLPKNINQALQKQNIPVDQLIYEYIKTAPPVQTLQAKQAQGVPFRNNPPAGMGQNQPENTPLQPQNTPIPANTPYESGFKDLIEEGRNKFNEHMNVQEIPEKPKNRELKLNRGSTVLLPDGNLGEIEDVKQGIAKVKVGDKIRHKKLDELMESPKEAANAALELIKSFTPESKRSSHHALNTYDPVTNSAQFLFHNGDGYLVEDISPEEYEKLSNEIEEATTTGKNKIGAWATGEGSRGAAYQKIVKKLKKPYRKIQVGYNLFKEFQRLVNEKE
ncbi:MAG TPA: hypothetical protein VHZ50_16440 [Puia sp.]|jgi:hypothetical protein|nr:hypothetical protein [Puia sp.]